MALVVLPIAASRPCKIVRQITVSGAMAAAPLSAAIAVPVYAAPEVVQSSNRLAPGSVLDGLGRIQTTGGRQTTHLLGSGARQCCFRPVKDKLAVQV